jgi:hypothetical protein
VVIVVTTCIVFERAGQAVTVAAHLVIVLTLVAVTVEVIQSSLVVVSSDRVTLGAVVDAK